MYNDRIIVLSDSLLTRLHNDFKELQEYYDAGTENSKSAFRALCGQLERRFYAYSTIQLLIGNRFHFRYHIP